jgi:hypothetical protein
MSVIIGISSLTNAMPSSMRFGRAMIVVERAYTARLPSGKGDAPSASPTHLTFHPRSVARKPPTGPTEALSGLLIIQGVAAAEADGLDVLGGFVDNVGDWCSPSPG